MSPSTKWLRIPTGSLLVRTSVSLDVVDSAFKAMTKLATLFPVTTALPIVLMVTVVSIFVITVKVTPLAVRKARLRIIVLSATMEVTDKLTLVAVMMNARFIVRIMRTESVRSTVLTPLMDMNAELNSLKVMMRMISLTGVVSLG